MEKSLAANAAYDAGHKAAIESAKRSRRECSGGIECISPAAPVRKTKRRKQSPSKCPAPEVELSPKPTEEKTSGSIVSTDAPLAASATAVSSEISQSAEARRQATDAVAQSKPEAYAAAASMGSSAEAAVTDARSAEDNTSSANDAGNKQQLAAAWEQWQNVRETVLNSPVAEQITEVAVATLNSMVPSSVFFLTPRPMLRPLRRPGLPIPPRLPASWTAFLRNLNLG